MIIDRKLIGNAFDEAIGQSIWKKEGKPDKVRKFDEAIDMIVNIREIDIKNPNNQIEQEHLFPHPINDKKMKVCFFASGDLVVDIKKRGIDVIDNETLDNLNKKANKDKKQIVKKYDYFVSQGDMMRTVAKVLARFLGQQRKMPKPQPKGWGVITPTENLDVYLAKLPCIAKLYMKKQLQIQVKVGKKNQNRQEILENIESLLIFLENRFPNGQNNIKSIFFKTTMGPSVKVKEGSKK